MFFLNKYNICKRIIKMKNTRKKKKRRKRKKEKIPHTYKGKCITMNSRAGKTAVKEQRVI